jgi:hypothetical protein
MLQSEHLKELKGLKEDYLRIYESLDELNTELNKIELKKMDLVQELNDLRELEKSTINKIEESLGRKLESLELIKLLEQ